MAYAIGHRAIQRCLDMHAITHHHAILLKDAVDRFLFFGQVADYRELLYADSITFPVVPHPVTMTISGVNSLPTEKRAKTTAHWSSATRFYRLSQASNNVFDAYRNLWLAFESLLNQVSPIASSGTRYTDWVAAACDRFADLVNLNGLLPPKCVKPGSFLFKKYYIGFRNPIFHTRMATKLVPGESISYSALETAYEELTRIFLRGIEHVSHFRWQSGAMYPSFWRSMIRDIAPRCMGYYSDSLTTPPVGQTSSDIDQFNVMSTAGIEEDDDPHILYLVTHADFIASSNLRITEAGIMIDNDKALSLDLESNLHAENINRFTVKMKLRMNNLGMPRRSF